MLRTKLDKFDVFDFDNNDFISKFRRQSTLRKSGGIGDFIKHDFAPYLKVINSVCEYVLWFKLSKSLFRFDEDVLFGAVYIPPDNSKYFRNDLHELFYEDTMNLLF